MLRRKSIDRICVLVMAAVLLLTGLFTALAATGVIVQDTSMGYENRLFDQSRVHTIDLVMDDWDAFLSTAVSETYASCSLVIDGEKYGNVAIRGKGNTSLSSVAAYGNNRYSFKVEFDHYQSGLTYHGLDKLSLNNIIQDATYMKDYWSYTLMNKMGVPSPLCSFVQINVNGEPWGLYLAVEGVEESFLMRNYGKSYGELYKPDSMSFGGGRGNGEGFDFADMAEKFGFSFDQTEGGDDAQPAMPTMPQGFTPPEGGFTPPDGFDPFSASGSGQAPGNDGREPPSSTDEKGNGGGFGGFGGFGSNNDVKLVYTDDDPDSYANIFNNAKTKINDADKTRLIAAIKAVNEGDTSAVNAEEVIRYLVVHSFLCNDDSYTGMMVHNYYLYEKDGVLSIIPWDYNLAMGGFTGGSNATSTVNSSISSPVSGGSVSDRPLIAWIFDGGENEAAYDAMYAAFVQEVFTSGWFEQEFDRVRAMIDPYVQADSNGFYTYDEFTVAADTLREFCLLRIESIKSQLDGSEEQVDASHLSLSAMGGMNTGGQGGPSFDWRKDQPQQSEGQPGQTENPETPSGAPAAQEPPAGFEPSSGMPSNMEQPSGMPADMEQPSGMPDGFAASDGSSGGQSAASATPVPTATEAAPEHEDDQTEPTGTPSQPSAEPTGDTVQNNEQPQQQNERFQTRTEDTETEQRNIVLLLACCAALLVGLVLAGCYKSNLH